MKPTQGSQSPLPNQNCNKYSSMESSQALHPNKNTFKLQLRKEGPILTISSDFDSGNMEKAQVGLNGALVITPANDCSARQNPSHSKGWFFFSVVGASPQLRLKIIIKKMNQMSGQLKFSEYFRPVYKIKGQEWQRVEQAMEDQRR